MPASSAVWRFLVDENLPRPLAPSLRAGGYDVEDARDVGLRGQPDTVVFAYAQSHNRTIVTLDKGLGSIQVYPTPHAGIVIVRLPDRLSISARMNIILTALQSLAGQSLANAVITVEPGRVRIHR